MDMEHTIDEYNRISLERLQAKRACEHANDSAEYESKLKIFRHLDHQREELAEQMRRDRRV